MKQLTKITFLILLLFSQAVSAGTSGKQLDEVLALKEEPEGIVIEILAGKDGLSWALPLAKTYIKKIRQRFPDIHIAIVSHGDEQFALQKQKRQQNRQVHSLTESLVTDSSVSFHVCGTYASMHDVSEEDFPEYVNVSPAGPAQINDYLKLGYKKIYISRKDKNN